MDCVGCDKCRLWGKLQVITILRLLAPLSRLAQDILINITTIAHVRYIKFFQHDSEAFWSYSYILFGFLCAQVSSGNCETMESLKIFNFVPKASESC